MVNSICHRLVLFWSHMFGLWLLPDCFLEDRSDHIWMRGWSWGGYASLLMTLWWRAESKQLLKPKAAIRMIMHNLKDSKCKDLNVYIKLCNYAKVYNNIMIVDEKTWNMKECFYHVSIQGVMDCLEENQESYPLHQKGPVNYKHCIIYSEMYCNWCLNVAYGTFKPQCNLSG